MLRQLIFQSHSSEEPVAWNGEMSVTIMVVCIYHLVQLIGASVCSKTSVENFWDVYFSCVMAVDSNIIGFSGNLFAVLVFCLVVGDVVSVVGVGNAVCVTCAGDMKIVFICSIFYFCRILLCKKSCNVLLGRTICRLCFF